MLRDLGIPRNPEPSASALPQAPGQQVRGASRTAVWQWSKSVKVPDTGRTPSILKTAGAVGS